VRVIGQFNVNVLGGVAGPLRGDDEGVALVDDIDGGLTTCGGTELSELVEQLLDALEGVISSPHTT
jgi:hypothetical protein